MQQTTEGSAVFVGRASFRMTPPARASLDTPLAEVVTNKVDNKVASQVDSKAVADTFDGPAGTTGSTTMGPQWFVAPEERVVLAPPDGVHTAEADVTDAGGVSVSVGASIESADAGGGVGGVDVAGGGFVVSGNVLETPNVNDRLEGHARPVWLIAAAVAAGAILTLSAQAVLFGTGHRTRQTVAAEVTSPPKPAPTSPTVVPTPVAVVAPVEAIVAPSPGAAPAPSGSAAGEEAAPSGAEVAAAPAVAAPTTEAAPPAVEPPATELAVAPPVVALLPRPEPGADRARRNNAAATERTHRARGGRATARANPRLNPARRSSKRLAATWVDPFASRGMPDATAGAPRPAAASDAPKVSGVARAPTTAPSGGGATTAKVSAAVGSTKWVDPFAN